MICCTRHWLSSPPDECVYALTLLSLSKFSLDELAPLAEVRRSRVCSSRLILLSRCWQSTPQEDHEREATAGRARLARARAVYAAHPLPCALIPAVPRVVLCSRVCSSGRTETGSARPRSLAYVMVLRTVAHLSVEPFNIDEEDENDRAIDLQKHMANGGENAKAPHGSHGMHSPARKQWHVDLATRNKGQFLPHAKRSALPRYRPLVANLDNHRGC